MAANSPTASSNHPTAEPLSDALTQIGNLLANSEPPLTIFDVGAYQGWIYQKFRRLFPGARVECFEPFPESFAQLLAKTEGDPLVRCHQAAMGATGGTARFHINHFAPTNSLLPRASSSRRYYPTHAGALSEVDVPVVACAGFCQNQGIEKIDLLKLDVQGGELACLQGAAPLLEARAVSVILCEVMFVPHYENGPLFSKICSFLEQFDYTLYSLPHLRSATNGQLRFGDAIFISPDIRRTVVDAAPEEP
jgi:FkbM family methyltransferase